MFNWAFTGKCNGINEVRGFIRDWHGFTRDITWLTRDLFNITRDLSEVLAASIPPAVFQITSSTL